jgi:hypothetical protein
VDAKRPVGAIFERYKLFFDVDKLVASEKPVHFFYPAFVKYRKCENSVLHIFKKNSTAKGGICFIRLPLAALVPRLLTANSHPP